MFRFSARTFSTLKERFADLLPEVQRRLATLKKVEGEKSLGTVTIDQVIGGMRGITGLLYETSRLDSYRGIKFRGLSLPECQVRLPSVKREPIPEAILYLLLTGEVPSNKEISSTVKDLAARASSFPKHAEDIINSLPKSMHPMSQLSIGVMALQTESEFSRAYNRGIKKSEYWEPTYEDALNLIARIPRIAALIYNNKYGSGSTPAILPEKDLSANFCNMIGFTNEDFYELMRLYFTIHCDHEGGNVSAHATHLVGSALSDPYLSFAAGLNGLAGPLHGLANQECLRFLLKCQEEIGNDPDDVQVEQFVRKILNSGQVVPGYGHAVLRVTDPRFICQMEFAARVIPHDPLCRLVNTMYRVVPGVLKDMGKAKNPYPNVDAHSGALLVSFGMKEFEFYTVLFGVSRAIGCMANLVWSRGLGLPIERPNSVTMEDLEALVKN